MNSYTNLAGSEQNRKKHKAPDPPLSDSESIQHIENKNLENINQIIKPKENHKSNIDEENGNWNIEREEVQNDNERQKYDTGIKSPLYDKNIGSIHENDERFSPEKENALQTLDAVIQEVEDSLGTKPLYFIYTQHIYKISSVVDIFPIVMILIVLGCDDDDIENLTETELNCDTNTPKMRMKQNDMAHNKRNKISAEDTMASDFSPCIDDIKIIDLESRGEDGSVSSYDRSLLGSPSEVTRGSCNNAPSSSASFSDRERDMSSHHFNDSYSQKEDSPSRYNLILPYYMFR